MHKNIGLNTIAVRVENKVMPGIKYTRMYK